MRGDKLDATDGEHRERRGEHASTERRVEEDGELKQRMLQAPLTAHEEPEPDGSNEQRNNNGTVTLTTESGATIELLDDLAHAIRIEVTVPLLFTTVTGAPTTTPAS